MRRVPSQSYGASPATWDHTVLPATRHKWTRPALPPASKLVLDLPTPEGWKAVLTGRESNSRSLDHKSDALATTPPSPVCQARMTYRKSTQNDRTAVISVQTVQRRCSFKPHITRAFCTRHGITSVYVNKMPVEFDYRPLTFYVNTEISCS